MYESICGIYGLILAKHTKLVFGIFFVSGPEKKLMYYHDAMTGVEKCVFVMNDEPGSRNKNIASEKVQWPRKLRIKYKNMSQDNYTIWQSSFYV